MTGGWVRERAREEFRRVLTHTFRREKEKWKTDGTFNDVPKTIASLFAIAFKSCLPICSSVSPRVRKINDSFMACSFTYRIFLDYFIQFHHRTYLLLYISCYRKRSSKYCVSRLVISLSFNFVKHSTDKLKPILAWSSFRTV